MRTWMLVNVLVLLSAIPLAFISPGWGTAVFAAGALSTVLRLVRR